MDPFDEVQEDAWNALETLEQLVATKLHGATAELAQDFANNYQELEEIHADLEQAVAIGEADPDRFRLGPDDVRHRKTVLDDLKTKMALLKARWDGGSGGKTGLQPREITTMANRISQDSTGPGGLALAASDNPFADSVGEYNQFQQQELILQQDTQLDAIHVTMTNLNQQATLMGSELEEQGFMLDQLDNDMDHLDTKMQRGMKRINRVIERNRERASDWCIGILAVALCVLLVLVIAI